MDANEEYVRDLWEEVSITSYHQYGKVTEPIYQDVRLGDYICMSGYDTESEAWSAAAEFTRQREEEIRQVEEEIRYLQIMADEFNRNENDWATFSRILAREQAALAELKRGMRGGANAENS